MALDPSTFSAMSNADLTVTRTSVTRDADGATEGDTTTVLQTRGDLQTDGETLQQQQAFFEAGDALFFPETGVGAIQPGDAFTVETDGGRTYTGSVEEVAPLSQMLLLSLDG